MVSGPHITRRVSQGVTLLGDESRPGGVMAAFTERTGGCSQPPYASLNLGASCGDDSVAVAANRRTLLAAMGVPQLEDRLVSPKQVHGSDVLVICEGDDASVRQAQDRALSGCDAVVCRAQNVPVLLCFADCLPLILVASGAFAVVHSGWRGTEARIAAKALESLCSCACCAASDVWCYIGPHIGADDYEVSPELAERFVTLFGSDVSWDGRHLDLGCAVRATLVEAGVPEEQIWDELPSTASHTDRFFSYRAEGGICGRHGAIAVMTQEDGEEA